MSDPARWTEQWDRVFRWLSRVQETAAGRPHDRPTDWYQDEVYAFFQNCWHLKDWLKNDPAAAASAASDVETFASDVETFASESPNLCLCADLANGSKHLRLKRPRVDPETEIGRRDYKLAIGSPGGETISVRYGVDAGGKTHDALELAEACWKAWQTYLSARGLLGPAEGAAPASS